MTLIKWSRFPLVAGDEYARRWLQFTANIGRAAPTRSTPTAGRSKTT